MVESDALARHSEACKNAAHYPHTLIKNTTSGTVLGDYGDRLLQSDAVLFHGTKHCIVLWELGFAEQGTTSLFPNPMKCTMTIMPDYPQEFQMKQAKNIKDLTENFQLTPKKKAEDPKCRYV